MNVRVDSKKNEKAEKKSTVKFSSEKDRTRSWKSQKISI